MKDSKILGSALSSGLAIASLVLVATGSLSHAAETRKSTEGRAPTQASGDWQTIATSCATTVGISLPESHEAFEQLDQATRDSFHQCMQAKGAPPPPGHGGRDHEGPPPPELREAMDACLTSKGVTPPAKGERPTEPPSESVRAAVRECHRQVSGSQSRE